METIKTIGWILLLWIISPFIWFFNKGGNIMEDDDKVGEIKFILILIGILGAVITVLYLI